MALKKGLPFNNGQSLFFLQSLLLPLNNNISVYLKLPLARIAHIEYNRIVKKKHLFSNIVEVPDHE